MKKYYKVLGLLLATVILLCPLFAFATEYVFDESWQQYYNENTVLSETTEPNPGEATIDESENDKSNILIFIAISLLFGVLAALIFIKAVKSKHKSVIKKSTANDYVVPGSLNLTQSYEAFLYKNVSKTERQQNNTNRQAGK